MKRISFNLPARTRLDVRLVKRRKLDEKPLIPNLGIVSSVKKGHKLSRFFRHVFEHKRMKKLLGANLAFLFMATSVMPAQTLSSTEVVDTVVAQKSVPLKTEKTIQYPVEDIKINQGYRFYHPGLDLDGETGDDIFAIMPGTVEATQYSNYAYGNAIYVNHENGYSSLYAHLSKIFVEPGDSVDMWTIIGDMGSTGRSTGSHLHLEVYQNGSPVNPYIVLPQ